MLSLPLAFICLQTDGSPPETPSEALRPQATEANAAEGEEVDAGIGHEISAAVTVLSKNQLAIENLRRELEAAIAVRDAASKSTTDIAARITEAERKAANDEEQQIARVMEALNLITGTPRRGSNWQRCFHVV